MLIFHKGMLCKEDGDLSLHDLEALGSLKKKLARVKITRKVLDGFNDRSDRCGRLEFYLQAS